MDVKIEVIGRDGVADSDKKDVHVETHLKRGDMFNVAKLDTIREGESVTFKVPDGGRLMLVTPEGDNEIIYDAAQGAAIRRSAQVNDAGKADDARTGDQRQAAELGRRHDQGEGQPASRVQTSGVRPNPQPQAGVRTPTQAEITAKVEADRKAKEASDAQAKQRQQTGSGINPGGTVSTDNLKDQK